MKEGAFIGAVIALLVYVALPVYVDNGQPATIFPTAAVVADTPSFNNYLSNLPVSMILFFALELLGVSLGITSQIVLKKAYPGKQN